jgi:hypothetical protein
MIFKYIKVLKTNSTDRIFIYSNDLTTAFPIMQYEPSLSAEAQSGYGEEWCALNFPGVPVTVINVGEVRDV